MKINTAQYVDRKHSDYLAASSLHKYVLLLSVGGGLTRLGALMGGIVETNHGGIRVAQFL